VERGRTYAVTALARRSAGSGGSIVIRVEFKDQAQRIISTSGGTIAPTGAWTSYTRDMSAASIVAAVARVAETYRECLGGVIAVLNQFRWWRPGRDVTVFVGLETSGTHRQPLASEAECREFESRLPLQHPGSDFRKTP
jgi:hypothetical protein